MPKGVPRIDITVEDVVQRWLFEGESMLSIAVSYDIEMGAISKRVQQGRERWPDLPWSQRKPNQAVGPTVEWIAMRDGKAGERETAGSIVRGRKRFRRT